MLPYVTMSQFRCKDNVFFEMCKEKHGKKYIMWIKMVLLYLYDSYSDVFMMRYSYMFTMGYADMLTMGCSYYPHYACQNFYKCRMRFVFRSGERVFRTAECTFHTAECTFPTAEYRIETLS